MYIPITRRGNYTVIESSGIDLNFEIVNGKTQPENPKENTIWVQTDNDIGGWIFSPTKPENVVDGTVWFRTITSGKYEFNALPENTINIVFGTVEQYDYNTNAWTVVPSYIYQNEQWTECVVRNYLIKDGVTEYTLQETYYGEYTQGNGYIKFGSGTYGASAIYINDVDLTDYDIIVVKGAFDANSSLRIWASSASPSYDHGGSASVTLDTTSNVTFLNVENFNGIYKVGIAYDNSKVNQISDLYLAGGGDI